jgi:hypothetical protein
LRGQWRKPCRFESGRRHHHKSGIAAAIAAFILRILKT